MRKDICQNSDAYQCDDDNVRAMVDLSQEWLDGLLPSRNHHLDVILCTLIKFINVIYLKESFWLRQELKKC